MGADIDLRMARLSAERNMRDRVDVSRQGADRTWNEETGVWEYTQDVIYSGKSRLKHPRAIAKQGDAGGQLIVSTHLELQIPVDSPDLQNGDIVTVTQCPDRPRQVGRTFKVLAAFDGSQTTSLRYRVEATDGR